MADKPKRKKRPKPTQLTMRTFHTGGIFSGEVAETIQTPVEGILYYNTKEKGKKIITKYNEKAFLTLEEKEVKIYKTNQRKFKIKIPEYSLILIRPNSKVYNKQILAERINKKQTKKTKDIKEIKSSLSGTIIFNEKKGKYLWISSSNIVRNDQIFKKLKQPRTKKILKIS